MHDTNVRYGVGLTSKEANVVILEEEKYRRLLGTLAFLEDGWLQRFEWHMASPPTCSQGSGRTSDRVSSMNNF